MPSMEEADPKIIIDAVRDPTCMAIHPHTEENLQKLEELMPLAEVPRGMDVVSDINEMEPLSAEQRRQIRELFKDMEVAHEHLVHSCSTLGILSRTLKSKQLIILLKVRMRSLIHMNAMPGWFKELEKGGRK